MDNNLDNNQGGRRPDKGDPRRDQDPNRNKKIISHSGFSDMSFGYSGVFQPVYQYAAG